MINLNYNSNTPLYMQIVDQTKQAIAKGLFKDGDKFPSVRDLSKTLMINQSTVSKAFKELDRLGLIESKPGVGTFIKIDQKKIEKNLGEFTDKLIEDFKEAIFLGLDKDEIIEIFEQVKRSLKWNLRQLILVNPLIIGKS